MTNHEPIYAWCDEPLQSMSLDRLREVHAEMKRDREVATDFQTIVNLSIGMCRCVTLAHQRIREWAEGMCM